MASKIVLNKAFIFLIILIYPIKAYNQMGLDSLNLNFSVLNNISNNKHLPFWLYTNNQNKLLINQLSSTINLEISNINTHNKNFYLDYSFEPIINIAQSNSKLFLNKAFLSLGTFFIKTSLGIKPIILGNQSNELSTGGLIFSGNSRSFPLVEFSIPEYLQVPFTFKLLNIKGSIGNAILNDNPEIRNINVHYKDFFLELGGNLPVKLEYGFIHAVQWGGNSKKYGQLPSGINDFIDVFFGKSGENNSPVHEQLNALGNHIASQNLALKLKINKINVNAYVQSIHDDAPINLIFTDNYTFDKLLGFHIEQQYFKYIKSFLVEFLNTTDQSGPYHDKDGIIFGGNDNYYNNGIYSSGWTYQGFTIGSPLITSPLILSKKFESFKNNKVKAWHLGCSGQVLQVDYKFVFTTSHNFGTNLSSFNKQQKSMCLYLNKKYKSYNFMTNFAIDNGSLLGNSFGIMIGIKKNFNFSLKK